MKVIAREQGFFQGARKRVGDIFEMPEASMKKDKDGKPALPQWVEPFRPGDTDELMRDYVKQEQLEAEARFMGGAIAASAPRGKEQLRGQFKKLFGVLPREERMVKGALAASGEGAIGKAAMARKLEPYQEALNRQFVGQKVKTDASKSGAGSTNKGEAK
jgi:hypothetical protein